MSGIETRLKFVDSSKGICILLIVLWHSSFGFIDNTMFYNIMSTVCVPSFFLISGFFAKCDVPFVLYVSKKINKLLIPFLFWFFTSAVIAPFLVVNVLNYRGDIFFYEVGFLDFFRFFSEDLYFNNPIWFLLCLFELSLIFYIICALERKYNIGSWFVYVSTLIVGFIGYSLGAKYHINIPMYIDTAMTALPFYSFGDLIRKKTNLLYSNNFDKYNWIIIVVGVIIVISIACPVTYFRNQFIPHSLLKLYISGSTGVLVILLIAKLVEEIHLFSYLGKYSIIVLVTHMFVLPVWQKLILNFFHSQSLIGLFFVMVGTIVSMLLVIPFCKRFVPFAVAQKDIIKI